MHSADTRTVIFPIVISVVLVLGVGAIDYITGFELNLSILYLIPLAILTWYTKLGIAVCFAVISALEWFLADMWFGHEYTHSLIAYWNALVWLGVFLLFVGLLYRLRLALETERRLARFDHLTGVLNARAFMEILATESERSCRYHTPLTLAYLDCDNFKPVNDQFGHDVGDRLLCLLAETMHSNLRQSDHVARIGGDEFVILITNSTFMAAHQALEKIRDRVAHVMLENDWPVTLSIGAITYERPVSTPRTLLKETDQLMYTAKQGGKSRMEHISREKK